MANLIPITDLYLLRLARVREAMQSANVPGMLVLDPVNILYATGASNMTLFSVRTPSRYLLIFAEGPVILYDYFGCEHLAIDLPTVTEIRPAMGLCFTSSNDQMMENAASLATEIKFLMQQYAPGETLLAIDRFPYLVADALRSEKIHLCDADSVFYLARKNKAEQEIAYMQEAMIRVENAVDGFRQALQPGFTESQAWAELHRGLIGTEGRYVATRLMQSGENTFPYFQECSGRVLQDGDLVCLDTDAIGFHGYAVDFSRTYICGDQKPTEQQQKLYQLAREQLEHNVSIIAPGKSYKEVADQAWLIPEAYQQSRYYCIGHGLGMSGERPNIPHSTISDPYPLNGEIEPGMVLCIESYIGSSEHNQGVKLEQQLLVGEDSVECMSQSEFDGSFG